MDQLPVDCISHILAYTSPKDVCRLAGVSSTFRSAGDSDFVWKTFLPADYREIIALSPMSSLLGRCFFSEKALYFHLSDHPLFIDGGNSSFSLDKASGKKCYMMGAKNLEIFVMTSRNPQLRWRSDPQSRFSQVVEVDITTPLLIRGKIKARRLSPNTYYGAYLVFKLPSTGWMEIEISKAFMKGENALIVFYIHPIYSRPKLIIQGIDIRPVS